jgi:VRR-NUC domain
MMKGRKGSQLNLLVSKGKEKIPTEFYEQVRLATWLDKMGIRFYAIPNGGLRSYTEAVKLKRGGVKAGVPDICIPMPSGGFHGLYIELKRTVGGKLSSEQAEWLAFLDDQGHIAVCAKGFEEAKRYVEDYFGWAKGGNAP